MKVFYSLASFERGKTVGGPGHQREICSREYVGDPPPPPLF